MNEITSKYAAADWVRSSLKVEKMSPLGVNVANILGAAVAGIYHIDSKALRRVDWACDYCVEISIGHTDLATYDGALLTMLVILCHDAAVRLTVMPHTFRHLRLRFHPRQRDGQFSERHWTIEQAAEACRRQYTVGDEMREGL